MSTLIASRLSMSGRRCCIALSRKSQQSPRHQVSRKIVNFKSGYTIAPEIESNHFKQIRLIPRHLSGYISSQEDDHLKCWNCQEDFSHCVHSMVRIITNQPYLTCTTSPDQEAIQIISDTGECGVQQSVTFAFPDFNAFGSKSLAWKQSIQNIYCTCTNFEL